MDSTPFLEGARRRLEAAFHENEESRRNDAKTRALNRAVVNSEGTPQSITYFDHLRDVAQEVKGWRRERERLWVLAQLAGDSNEDAARLLAALDELRPEPQSRAERLVKVARLSG